MKFRWMMALSLLALPTAGQAGDYSYTTNFPDTNTITITAYTGPGGAVTIPSNIGGRTVTRLGNWAFWSCESLTSVAIPTSVTSIEVDVFGFCSNLTSVAIPNSVTSIGLDAFWCCISLTNATIPNNVANIGGWAFYACSNLNSVTIGHSVTNIGEGAFQSCADLAGAYFLGNAPAIGLTAFTDASSATVYYLPGTTGWTNPWDGRPTVLWNPKVRTDSRFGVRTNLFGFTITATNNYVVVVEACTNLVNPAWSALQTDMLTGAPCYFSDPQWTNYPTRFYRLRMP